MPQSFSYNNLWASKSHDTPIRTVGHAKYDFAVAYPAPETLPMDGLIKALQVAVDTKGDQIAREMAYYPHVLGLPELRELTARKLLEDRGFRVSADEIVLTAGSGEANGLIIQALVNPGEVVITEQYVYGGTLNQLRHFQAEVIGTPCDDEGIIPDALDELLKKLDSEGRRPKLIYTIPEHQNPMGSTLPEARKRRILDIAHKYGIPILEDECYVDLRFEGERQPAFRTLDDSGIVIHVASFSKLIAPGLRMGYFTGAEEVRRRALSMKHGSGPNQFAAYAIEGFLNADMDSHRDTSNSLLKKKRDAMDRGLSEFFSQSGARWSRPQGGCYSWLTMPEGRDISAIRDRVFEGGVGYLAGINFAPNGDGQNCARLCFAFESPEKNYEGIKLLAELFKQNGVM